MKLVSLFVTMTSRFQKYKFIPTWPTNTNKFKISTSENGSLVGNYIAPSLLVKYEPIFVNSLRV